MYQNMIRATLRGLAVGALLANLSFHNQTKADERSRVHDIVDLSKNLGRAHAVRIICNGHTDQHWRRYMHHLLQIETPETGYLHTRMIQAFNAGFAQVTAGNPVCSDDIRESEKQFAAAGQILSARLAQASLPQNEPDSDDLPTVTATPDDTNPGQTGSR